MATTVAGAAAAEAAGAAAAAAQRAAYQPIKRVRASVDHLTMQPMDTDQVHASLRSTDLSLVSWLLPVNCLQDKVHDRFEVEPFAVTDTGTQLGFLTMVASNNNPGEQSRFERWMDPPPHPTLSFNIACVDRHYWQRTSWCVRSYVRSSTWGRIPASVYGVDISNSPVQVRASFDEEAQRYSEYAVEVPELDFQVELEDTGEQLFDPATRTTECFVDNESAMRVLALNREVVMRGHGGSVCRQPLWSPMVNPNLARLKTFNAERVLATVFNTEITTDPVAAWLVREVPETKVYMLEANIEDENDPASASKSGEKGVHMRVQNKAMNRYQAFRDDVRAKTYSDIDNTELPR